MRKLACAASAACVAVALPACAAPMASHGSGYCAPPTTSTIAIASDPPPPVGAPAEERMAALLGLRAAFDARATDEATRLKVLERIELARIAIAATAAELDCEGARADQAASALSRTQSSEVQGLTIASIGASALTAIAGVFLSTKSASAELQDGVAIGGGLATAALAIGSLYVHPRVAFPHERNLLADVWTGPTSSPLYPSFLWTYFSRPEFSNDGKRPIREKIVERWRRFKELDDDRALEALLVGAGGAYDVDALRTRSAMLDEVKAEVQLCNQDVAAFAGAILR